MECKCELGRINKMFEKGELIDTLWNVNFSSLPIFIQTAVELIDTLWNVNFIFRSNLLPKRHELIDTLWNVNRLHEGAKFVGGARN